MRLIKGFIATVRTVRIDVFHATLLLLFGSLAFYYFVAEPAILTIRSSQWSSVPCTVMHPGDKAENATTGHVLTYKYNVNGNAYIGRRLSSGVTDKGGEWMQEFGDGEKTVCYVNPMNPQQSVLTRGWGRWIGALVFGLAVSFLLITGAFHALLNAVHGKSPQEQSYMRDVE
jgi:hypothetical protein